MLKGFLNKIRIKLIKGKFGRFGQNCSMMPGWIISDFDKIELGDDIYIGPNAYIWASGGLEIHSNVIIGPRITIHTSNHRYEGNAIPYDGTTILRKVIIEKNVWIGDQVLICPGVRIGEGSVIAMGSVVTKDVPPLSIVGGNPARVIKMREKENYLYNTNEGNLYLPMKRLGKIIWNKIHE